jgi:hypothetical protein
MKTVRLLALAACALSAACKSEVVTIDLTVKEDGSGFLQVHALRGIDAKPMTKENEPIPTSGLAAGQVSDVAFRHVQASFADVRRVALGGITFDFAQTDDGHRLRVSVPARADAAWRKLIPPVAVRSAAEGAASRTAEIRGESRDDKKRKLERERHEVVDLRVIMPGKVVSQSVDAAGRELGWRYECDEPNAPCSDSTHLVIPIAVTGQEPERVVWEVRTKEK